MKIKISVVFHYLLIYLMLMIPRSCFFAKYLNNGNTKYIFIIGLYILLIILKKKYRSMYSLKIIIWLFIFTLFTRLLNGGAGIRSFLELIIVILSAQIAICYDKENFLKRLINMVVFFATISIFFWLLFLVFPNLVELWPANKYVTQIDGSVIKKIYHGKGLFFYSYLEIHPTRNCGFYTEPGVHQIILNITLFILLFWKNRINNISEKKYKKYIFILIITILTCQSTTGYIALVLIMLFFLFYNKDSIDLRKVKKLLLLAMILLCFIIVFDYLVNQENSIIYINFLKKIFNMNDFSIDFSNGTGKYRFGTIIVGINQIIECPFGVGMDAFTIAKKEYGDGLVAASLISFAAIYGIIPWFIMLFMLFNPVSKNENKKIYILFALLFINTTLAQTDFLYPAFIMIPMYLKCIEEKKGDKNGKNTNIV